LIRKPSEKSASRLGCPWAKKTIFLMLFQLSVAPPEKL